MNSVGKRSEQSFRSHRRCVASVIVRTVSFEFGHDEWTTPSPPPTKVTWFTRHNRRSAAVNTQHAVQPSSVSFRRLVVTKIFAMDGKIKKLYKIVLTGGKNDPLHTYRRYYEFIVVTYCVSKPISSYHSKVGSGWVPSTFRLLTTPPPPSRFPICAIFFFFGKIDRLGQRNCQKLFPFLFPKDG